MSFPKTQDWLVNDVREGKVENNPKGAGQLQKFYVDFEGAADVYWRRRAGDTPEIGKSYYGTISEGKFGLIFKKEKPESTPAQAGRPTRDFKPEAQFDPERVARIGRSHAQEMSLRLLAINGPEHPRDPAKAPRVAPADVFALADEFQADVDAAAKAARSGGAASGNAAGSRSSSDITPAAQKKAPDGAEFMNSPEVIQMLLERAEVAPEAAHAIARYANEHMTPEEEKAAVERLENNATRQGAINRLKERTEEHLGETLPVAPPPDDDIPF